MADHDAICGFILLLGSRCRYNVHELLGILCKIFDNFGPFPLLNLILLLGIHIPGDVHLIDILGAPTDRGVLLARKVYHCLSVDHLFLQLWTLVENAHVL